MSEERSTVRSRQLGDALRVAMEDAGLSGKRTAQVLGWSESRVSRFLTGKLSASEIEVAGMLAVFGVVGEERDWLLGLTREVSKLSWSRGEGLRALAIHEERAVRVSEFQLGVVPVLLQTEAYARAVVSRLVNVGADGGEELVVGRLGRRGVVGGGDGRQLRFFVHELALHVPVGGSVVMGEQLHHVLRLGVRPGVSVRVVPTAAGAHAGLGGSCGVLEFAESSPVAYVEGETATYFLEEPGEVSVYQGVFTALAAVALDQAQSKALISRLAIDRYGYSDHKNNSGKK